MSAEIIKVFDYIGEKLGIAIDWTQENLMPYLEDLVGRFVKLNIIENIIGIIVFGLILIVSVVCAITLLKSYKKCQAKKEDTMFYEWIRRYSGEGAEAKVYTGFFIAFIVCTFVAAIIGIPCNISELIKWIYIPEFQIAEEISYMMQTMGG